MYTYVYSYVLMYNIYIYIYIYTICPSIVKKQNVHLPESTLYSNF